MTSSPVSIPPLISAETLASHLDECLVIDVRHDLVKPAWGLEAYRASHIPSAHFLSQDTDLAGQKTGRNGRHPLPDANTLALTLTRLGLKPGKRLVAYDTSGGSFAARLWWLSRWLGHEEVSVLDGGLAAWEKLKLPLSSEIPLPVNPQASAPAFQITPKETPLRVEAIEAGLPASQWLIVDARAAQRYRGEMEPIDPVAGHIPGAINRPFALNLREDGRFKPEPVLRAEFLALLAHQGERALVHQCGSGVTACHNMLALAAAGLPTGQLYAGSWSEWCADPARPIAKD
jgi:thiosulfate/3-mercaptopyruvate sulfurtransferase